MKVWIAIKNRSMIKVIFEIIGVIIGVILLVGGILLGCMGINTIMEELIIINENIALGVSGIIYGLFIFILGYRIVQWIIKKNDNGTLGSTR